MLYTPVDLGVNACILDLVPDAVHDFAYKGFPLTSAQVDLFHQVVVDFRLQIF